MEMHRQHHIEQGSTRDGTAIQAQTDPQPQPSQPSQSKPTRRGKTADTPTTKDSYTIAACKRCRGVSIPFHPSKNDIQNWPRSSAKQSAIPVYQDVNFAKRRTVVAWSCVGVLKSIGNTLKTSNSRSQISVEHTQTWTELLLALFTKKRPVQKTWFVGEASWVKPQKMRHRAFLDLQVESPWLDWSLRKQGNTPIPTVFVKLFQTGNRPVFKVRNKGRLHRQRSGPWWATSLLQSFLIIPPSRLCSRFSMKRVCAILSVFHPYG